MRNQNETELIKTLKKLKSELQKNIEHNGPEAIKVFLSDNFALSRKDAKFLMQLFEKMIPGVPLDATPEDWYLKKRRRPLKKLIDHIPDMQREYPKLKYFVERFQKLSENLQLELRDYWTDELWTIVIQKHLTPGNRNIYSNSPSRVAKEILAFRYDSEFETVNSYLKRR